MNTYSFDLKNFEDGTFIATRFTGAVAVSGDWVCSAADDDEALNLARKASSEEWAAPDTRRYDDFTVEFVAAHQ